MSFATLGHMAKGHPSAMNLILFGLPAVLFKAYLVIAQWRMSRIPFVLFAGNSILGIAYRYYADPHWLAKFPILGKFAVLIPLGAISLMILIHWEKMTWNPLGRPAEPAFRPEQVF